MEQFHYLLNAFEQAAQADRPDDAGYAEKRAALIKHLTELNKDAERYRSLRDGCFTVLDDSSGYVDCCGVLSGVGLDTAIDAMMTGANT